jgi:hypothetical protein
MKERIETILLYLAASGMILVCLIMIVYLATVWYRLGE